ncbi:vitamin K epoxide reductase family protein [Brevibacterium sp.]|uniref:vitamin K epoxide reductase family protein n=1 Tax=Brevibacterium sp. TaxID=1701 RepID=UPI00264986F9|nr:vitamin K epoxide reductase family protein [Brevibacterium sp.]MDN6603488.1 vitamin K epoxide reductase family protein [Brevibacterium sp.]
MNTAAALPDDDIDTAAPTRSWVLRPTTLGIFLAVASVVGFLASFALAVEKYEKLENPNAVLSCDLNPFFSCGSVMEHAESQLFGFPNQLLGIGAFIFPLLLGVLLIVGAKIPGWVMVGLNVGLALGVVLVMFLFYISIYAIGVGCPWCMVVWTMTIPMFVAVTAHNALAGNFGAGIAQNPIARVLAKENVAIFVLWMLIIAACIVVQFWNFFSTLF